MLSSQRLLVNPGPHPSNIILGIDFDNTLARYDELFHSLAVERSLIPPDTQPTKLAVRTALRTQGLEREWVELQGLAYGDRLLQAPPFEAAVDTIRELHQLGCALRVVSHKTHFAARGPRYDLRDSALDWLDHNRVLDFEATGIGRAEVFFENTAKEKRERIRRLGCTHFIDDLREFLLHPEFPVAVERFLFDPDGPDEARASVRVITHWNQVRECITGNHSSSDQRNLAGSTIPIT